MADDSVDMTSLINALMYRQRPRVPFSDAVDAMGLPLDKPDSLPQGPGSRPAWLHDIQPYPIDPKAALEGLAMSSGMTGGPVGAVTSGLGRAKEAVMASPLVKSLVLGGAGLGITSTPAESQSSSSTLDKLLAQQAEIARQRAEAIKERDAQVTGKNGAKAGRGPNYDKAVSEVERLDKQAADLAPVLKAEQDRLNREQYNNSPQGKLEADQRRKAFEDEQAAKARGKPVRENLPEWAQDLVIPGATVAGALLTRHLAGKANAEYQRALDRFLNGQKKGDLAEMALGKAQLAELEKFSPMGALKTAGSALLPAEVRGVETAIDLSKPSDTRANIEANARIHDPWAVARDVGTTGISSMLAYGAGSKTAKPYVDRSLGRAIVDDPYGAAPQIAAQLERARELSGNLNAAQLERAESLRRLRQTGPADEARPAIAGPLVQALSGEVLPPQGQLPPPAAGRLIDKMQAGKAVVPPEGQLPAPEAGPSSGLLKALEPLAPSANRNSLPAGIPKDHKWDDRMKGSKIRSPDGTLAPMPKDLKDE